MAGWKGRPKEFKRLWNYSVGFYGVWVAHVGRRTGLIEAIANRAVESDKLAEQKSLDQKAVRAWCSAAEALGFLKRRGKKVYLPARMKEILLEKKSPLYLGGQFSYLALRSLDYGSLEDLVRTGKTSEMASSFDAIVEATDWDHHAFMSAAKRGRLHKMLSIGCRVLDVGCGTGTFIEKLLQEYPRSSFVGVEPSEAAHRAMEMAAGKSVEIFRQTGEQMAFESEFDLVYLGESLYAASDKPAIASNCFRALKKGGVVAIVEGLLPEKVDDESRLIMGMQLDFALQGFSFMTKKEISSLLKGAGFARVAFTDFGGSLYLVTAEKP
ncbi:MAG: class I SAM-dependent methyltransferase [Nitrososphaera sp.]